MCVRLLSRVRNHCELRAWLGYTLFRQAYFAEHTALFRALVCSDTDYMLALALQQEDASALTSASPTQPDIAGDEAVAMALLNEDRALLEQRTAGGNDDTTRVAGRQGVPVREDRDRFVNTAAAISGSHAHPQRRFLALVDPPCRSPFCVSEMRA